MNIKKLNEDKNTKVAEMETLLNDVKAEERAFTEDEQKQFDELKSQIEAINKTLEAFEASRELVDKSNLKSNDWKCNRSIFSIGDYRHNVRSVNEVSKYQEGLNKEPKRFFDWDDGKQYDPKKTRD